MTCKPCQDVNVLPLRIEIQKPSCNPGADGHTDLTDSTNWDKVCDRSCRFVTKSGREGMVFQRVQASVTHVIEFRSDPLTRSIQPTWRLKLGSRVFNIVTAYDRDEAKQAVYVEAIEEK